MYISFNFNVINLWPFESFAYFRLENSMGLLRFERKSMAPEATRIPSYPTGPKGVIQQKEKTDKRVFGERDRIKDLWESTKFSVFLRQNANGFL